MDRMEAGLTKGTVVDPRVFLVDITVRIQHLAARLIPIRNESSTKELFEAV